MSYRDLRDWLVAAEAKGELLRIKGAKADLEMASLAEIVIRESKQPKPAILFEDVPGYPKGFRNLFGLLVSPWKIASSLGLPESGTNRLELLKNWRKKSKTLTLIPPRFVKTGPVLDHSLTGDKVDLRMFPSPRFHEFDQAAYIGTACMNINQDPDEGWVNLGTYRNMVVDAKTSSVHALQAQQGSLIMQKWFAKGKPMPIAITAGQDPLLYWSSCYHVPWGVSEYDYAGGIKGEPIEVIKGPLTGLPIPAYAEIAIEGEVYPDDTVAEGPFGEWHGYYANLGLQQVQEPRIRVTAIHYRNDPIMTCAQMAVPFNDLCLQYGIGGSEGLWGRLEGWGIPGIKACWCHEIGGGDLFNVVSITQMYAGHAQAVALMASQFHLGGGVGRYTVVVDDDIDPSDLEQVVWAMITRMPADQSIQILPNCRSSSADPAIPLADKKKWLTTPKPLLTARAVINACRPYAHKADWYPVARVSPKLRSELIEKWQPQIKDYLQS